MFDKNISVGNIVSWLMIMLTAAVGFGQLRSSTTQNSKDVAEATALAHRVEESLRSLDTARAAQINALTVDMAVTKLTTTNIDKKLDELIRKSEKK
jgi:low affinity Fe/Cu permease